MKITAGLGSLDDYEAFVKAGADECFCGYVPDWWMMKYGNKMPLNRREVVYYNVQIGSYSEMEILRDMIAVYQVPVSIAVNALYYLPEQYPELIRYFEECLELGFRSFIIADMALLIYLHSHPIYEQILVTISGEFGEMNPYVARYLEDMGVHRLIFHRKMTINEMKSCRGELEYEAFLMNEKCHFHGAFCNSLHCDEYAHICRLPYQYSKKQSTDMDSELQKWIPETDHSGGIGDTGCGLCALWDLRDAGIHYLKIVGRGNYTDAMIRDIKSVRQALRILEESENRTDFQKEIKRQVFVEKCSGNCYYKL